VFLQYGVLSTRLENVYMTFIYLRSIQESAENAKQFKACFSTFLLQRNLPQMFALLVQPYAMIQVSILLSVINLMGRNSNFGLFPRNPWLPLAETCLKNTGLGNKSDKQICKTKIFLSMVVNYKLVSFKKILFCNFQSCFGSRSQWKKISHSFRCFE